MKIAILASAVALVVATPAAAETWQSFSRTSSTVYLIEVDSIVAEGEVTSLRMATVPRSGEAGDYSYSVETYQFRCAGDGGWRTAGIVDFGPDGSEAGRFPEDGAEWTAVRANTVPAFLKDIACGGARSTGDPYPTIQAFVDAGRP